MNTKQLRQKILDLAIRGKLVEYKIESWQNVRLGEVCDITSSKRIFKSEYTSFGVPFYRTKEIVELSHGKTVSTELFISNERYNDIKNSFDVPNNGDVLLSAVGTIGVSWVVDDRTFYFKDGNLLWLKKITSDSKYLKYTLDFHFAEHEIRNGSTYNALTIESLKKIFISLPPLAEQHRIVTAIDSAFAIIDEIERNKADLQTAVTAAKQKVLSLAIQGKLVPQDMNDEPAEVLLNGIRNKRKQLMERGAIRKEKPFADVDESKIPYGLPQSWALCRLGELAHYKKGPFGSSITKAMFVPDSEDAVKVYEQKNAIYKDASLGNYFVSQDKFNELKGFEVFSGDIIVSCAGTIGEAYIMPENMRQGIINQALMKISLYDERISDFYLMYFDFVLKVSAKDEAKGTAMKNIPPFDVLKQFFVPLPPLAEQQRIVEAIEAAFEQLDKIEQSLN